MMLRVVSISLSFSKRCFVWSLLHCHLVNDASCGLFSSVIQFRLCLLVIHLPTDRNSCQRHSNRTQSFYRINTINLIIVITFLLFYTVPPQDSRPVPRGRVPPAHLPAGHHHSTHLPSAPRTVGTGPPTTNRTGGAGPPTTTRTRCAGPSPTLQIGRAGPQPTSRTGGAGPRPTSSTGDPGHDPPRVQGASEHDPPPVQRALVHNPPPV